MCVCVCVCCMYDVCMYVCICILRFIAKKVCTACSRTSYKTVPLTNLNKYLYNGKSEIYNSSEKFLKKTHCD